MAGILRMIFGLLFLLAGLFFILTIFGFLFGLVLLLIGVALLVSGVSARSDAERLQQQQQQTNFLLQQQLQLNAALAARGAPAPGSAERYCPYCGQGNLRAATFCQRCGKPLPPPG